jgi:hypothetical protein
MYVYICLVILLIGILITFVSLYFVVDNKNDIYCLMITGYTPTRRKFALNSIQNWFNQTYSKKKLILLNQSKNKLMNQENENILELYIDNTEKTLGEIRNIALDLVPPNAYWTTWDDDDWRNEKYLQIMMNTLLYNNADMVMYTNRYEYNINSKFAFKSTLHTGFPIFFARKDDTLRYDNIKTLEDVKVKEYAIKHMKTYIYENNPNMYIRLIHNDNTSPYVDQNKNKIKVYSRQNVYEEHTVSKKEKEFIVKKISPYL